jgi:hypothetical protein
LGEAGGDTIETRLKRRCMGGSGRDRVGGGDDDGRVQSATKMSSLWRRLVQLAALALVMACGLTWLRPHDGWAARFASVPKAGPLPDTINRTIFQDLDRLCTPTDVLSTAPRRKSSASTTGWLDERWHPGHCNMPRFFDGDDDPSASTALAQCLKTTKIVLVGDSRVRQLYFYLVAALGRPRRSLDDISVKMHSDLNATLPLEQGGAVDVFFYWEPAVRTERGVERLLELGAEAEVAAAAASAAGTKTLLVQGAGLWELKADVPRSELALSVAALRAPTAAARRNPALTMYWLPIGGIIWDMLVKPRQTITDENVAWLDAQVRNVLGKELTYLDQVTAIYKGTGPAGTLDGLHYTENVRLSCNALPPSHPHTRLSLGACVRVLLLVVVPPAARLPPACRARGDGVSL